MQLPTLKPALQASGMFLGCRDQVLTQMATLKPALQAWWGHRDPFGLPGAIRAAGPRDGRFRAPWRIRAPFCWFGLPAPAIQA